MAARRHAQTIRLSTPSPTRTPTTRSSKDLQVHVEKDQRNHFAEALADPDSLHVDWPLHPGAAAAAARDISATQDFIRAWKRWPNQDEVIYASRNWSRADLRTNNVPTRTAISSVGAEHRRRFPDSPDFVHAIRRSYTHWKDSNSYDLYCLIPCLTWLRADPDSGEWECAVPVEGVDDKGLALTAAWACAASTALQRSGILKSPSPTQPRFCRTPLPATST